MMWRILLLAATVQGAAIPQNPSCLEKCLVAGGIVGAAADLNFFKSVAVDINNFCNVYTALLKCASGCSQDDLNLVMKHTMHASYVCKDKLEEIKTVHDCLESDTTDPLSDCGKVCEVTEHVPLRLDSTATAPVNPNVPAEGTGPLCGKQMCVLKCAREQLNKQCAGAGDLFKEIARHQVEIGWDMLQAQSENTNDTASQLVALSYLANIPEKCVYLTNLETFDKEIGGDMMKKLGTQPGMEFSNDTAIETESSPDSPLVTGGFDPTLFEFAPALEPDVPIGPPTEEGATTDSTAETLKTFPEEAVKILGDTAALTAAPEESEETTVPSTTLEPSTTTVEMTTSTSTIAPEHSESGSLAAAMDAPPETMGKMEEGVHEQPKPAEAPVASTEESTDEEPAATGESSDESADKNVTGRPIEIKLAVPKGFLSTDTEEGGDTSKIGLIVNGGAVGAAGASAGVSAEASSDEKPATEETETTEMDGAKAAESTDGKMEEAEKAEKAEDGEEMADDVAEEAGTAKDSEGAEMAMSTDSTIVVDDENESELEKNEINPVTEKAKVNAAPGSISLVSALLALVAVMFM